MQLPKKVPIGRQWYKVEQPKLMYRYGVMGDCDYANQTIRIATHSSRTGRPFTKVQRNETFWHELTHAILYDMKSKLARDERFVTKFAYRLRKAIDLARF